MSRSLKNDHCSILGVHGELTIQKGINSIKAGTVYQHTFLREHDNLGLVNATFNSPCVDANGEFAAWVHRSLAMCGCRSCVE